MWDPSGLAFVQGLTVVENAIDRVWSVESSSFQTHVWVIYNRKNRKNRLMVGRMTSREESPKQNKDRIVNKCHDTLTASANALVLYRITWSTNSLELDTHAASAN